VRSRQPARDILVRAALRSPPQTPYARTPRHPHSFLLSRYLRPSPGHQRSVLEKAMGSWQSALMFREWLVWSVGFIAPQRLDRSGPVAWGCRPPTASGLASITESAGWCETGGCQCVVGRVRNTRRKLAHLNLVAVGRRHRFDRFAVDIGSVETAGVHDHVVAVFRDLL